MSYRVTRCVALTLFILFVVGCAVRPGDPPVIDRLKPFLRLAVSLGTDRVLVENPTVAPVVLQVTSTLLTLFSTDEVVSLAQVNAAIRAKIMTMNLTPEVRMVLEALLQSVAMEIRLVIVQAGVADDTITLLLHEVVTWIRDAALRHVQMPPARLGR